MGGNITASEIIDGVQLDPSIVLSLMILCLGIVVGSKWGFDKIYHTDNLEKFNKYKSELISNFRFRLRKLGLTPFKDDNQFNEKMKELMEEWQNFGEEVNDYYNKMFWWRRTVLIIFALATVSYFLRLIRPDLILNSYKISFWSKGNSHGLQSVEEFRSP